MIVLNLIKREGQVFLLKIVLGQKIIYLSSFYIGKSLILVIQLGNIVFPFYQELVKLLKLAILFLMTLPQVFNFQSKKDNFRDLIFKQPTLIKFLRKLIQ